MLKRYLKKIMIGFALLAGATPMFAATPTIMSIGPVSGSTAGGTIVTITGTNLTGATGVSFGGTAGSSVTVVSSTTVTVVAPSHAAGAVTVTVTTSGGTSSGGVDTFTYTAPTTTSLAITTTGTLTAGEVVTLTATVKVTSGGAAVTTGTVKFCNSSLAANLCTVGRGLWGTAQLTSAGTAILRRAFPIGTNHIEAIFVGNSADATSTSSPVTSVAINAPTTLTYTSTAALSGTIGGSIGSWNLTGTVAGFGGAGVASATPDAPSGTVNLIDNTASGTPIIAHTTLGTTATSIFVAQQNISTGTSAGTSGIAIGDFNNDGIPDVITSDYGAEENSVLLGSASSNGTFTLGTATTFPLNIETPDVVVGDFSGTGNLGYAVAGAGVGVEIFTGNGSGTSFTNVLGANGLFSSGALYDGVAVGDFHNQGRLDVIASSGTVNPAAANTGSITLITNNGSSSFTTTTVLSGITTTAQEVLSVRVGDFDGDGNLDFVVFTGYGSTTVTNAPQLLVFYGNGNGTFTEGPAITLPADTGTPFAGLGLAVGDFNGDGFADIVVGNGQTHGYVYLSNGAARTFAASAQNPFTVTNGSAGFAIGDINGDGVPDLAAQGANGVTILLGCTASLMTSGACTASTPGTFATPQAITVPVPPAGGLGIAMADLNGDGLQDIAVAESNGTLEVLLGEQQTNFSVNGLGIPPAGGTPGTTVHGVSAKFSAVGDTLRTASALSNADNLTVGLETPVAVAKTSPTGTLIQGSSGTFTATLTSESVNGAAIAPTGTVNFTVGGTQLNCGLITVNSDIASCGESNIPAGTNQTITAVYGGDTNYISTSGTLTGLTVDAATTSTTVALTTGASPAVAGSSLTFTATITPGTGGTFAAGDTVSFTDAPGPALSCTAGTETASGTFSGHTFTFTASSSSAVTVACTTSSLTVPGLNTITAAYTSNSTSSPLAPSSGTISVGILGATTTTLASSGTSSVVGASVTFTATVTDTTSSSVVPSGGSVTFTDTTTSTTLCSGAALTPGTSSSTATCTTTALTTVGAHSITAAYSGVSTGTTFFTASTSSALTQTVNAASTTTTLATSNSSTQVDAPPTFTATVTVTSPGSGTPTGTVNFSIGGTVVGSGTLNASGQAEFTPTSSQLPVGSDSVVATYVTTTSFIGSTSATLTQTVMAEVAGETTPTVAVGSTSGTLTATLTFTALGTATTGTVAVLTQGKPNLDFVATGGTCLSSITASQTSCTVTYTFSPTKTGLRRGAITLTTSGVIQSIAYISGIGTGAQVSFTPAGPTTLSPSNLGPITNSQGIAVDGAGDVFVNSETIGNVLLNTVQMLPAGGGPAITLPVPAPASCNATTMTGCYPTLLGAAVDAVGNLWVVGQTVSSPSITAGVFEIMAPLSTSSTVTKVATTGTPAGVAIDGKGDVYVANTGGVIDEFIPGTNGKFTTNATPTVVASGSFTALYGIAVDAQGDVFVSTPTPAKLSEIVAVNGSIPATPTIKTLTAATGVTANFGLVTPTALAFDGNGNLFVSDQTNGIEEIPAPNYNTFTTLPSTTGGESIAIDGSGDIFFSGTSVKEWNVSTPPTLSFPTATMVGSLDTTDGTKTVTINNIGNESLNFSAPTISSAFAVSGTTCGASLSFGQSCTDSITFTPTVPGPNSGTLALLDNSLSGSANATQSINLSGTGTDTPTTTTITASPTTAVFGQSVTLTATVSPISVAGAGTVSFTQGGTAITGCGTQAVNASGVATCVTSSLPAGNSATINAQAAFTSTSTTTSPFVASSSTTSAAALTINSATTTTVLTSSANPSIAGNTVTLTATVSVGSAGSGVFPANGTVNLEQGGTTITGCGAVAVSSITGVATCTTPALSAGAVGMSAIYTTTVPSAGSPDYATSTGTLTQSTDTATTTTITASPTTAVFGQSVTLTAIVTHVSTTGTGTVSFTQNGTVIAGCGTQAVNASGVATCMTSSLPVGSSAQINAQAMFTSAVTTVTPFLASSPISSAATLTISQASTTTTLTSSGSTTTLVNAPPTFTATVAVASPGVGIPTGTVQFSINGSAVASPVALNGSGVATFTPTSTQLPAGNDTITAVYTATTSFATSTSSSISQTVLNGTSTSLALTSGTSTIAFGTQVTFTAIVSDTTGGPTPSGGTVTFTDNSNTTLCTVTLTAGSATCTPAATLLTVGSNAIIASYSGVMTGSNFFQASNSGTVTEAVTKASAMIRLASSSSGNPPTSTFGTTVTFTASFGASVNGTTPTGTVTFSVDGTPLSQGPVTISSGVATFNINNLTVVGVSGHIITAAYNGDNNFQ